MADPSANPPPIFDDEEDIFSTPTAIQHQEGSIRTESTPAAAVEPQEEASIDTSTENVDAVNDPLFAGRYL